MLFPLKVVKSFSKNKNIKSEFYKLPILTLNLKPLYHQCDQFSIRFIFIYVKSYCKANK